MSYTADFLIKKRKEKWAEKKDIEFDKEFRAAAAREILKDERLRQELVTYPEKIIELFFVVVTKDKKTEPFFLNAVQKKFIKKLNQAIADFKKGIITSISLIILKGRQQGFTTLITAYQLAMSISRRNFEGFTLADTGDNTEAIFQNKAKFPYSQLPTYLKPTERFNNRRQLVFSKINSSWECDTATVNVGRSRTINFFHGSECAFWKDGIARIQAALGEAMTKGCIKIYESTANGFNDYKTMWDSGEHINCFFAWWETPEYRTKIPNDIAREEFENVMKTDSWIGIRLNWLKSIELEEEQLYWYYDKWKKYIDKSLIQQEYPCTPEEAFLLSGNPAFDIEKINERLLELKDRKPIKTGYFKYDYDGLKITNIKWVSDRNGYIKIYQLPNTPEITKYCIGGDTAGEGSDYFTGHVLDARTGIQVARLKHQFNSDQYAKQMYCLGAYYKWALIGIEANYDSYPIMELQRLEYPNQYVRMKKDTYTGKTEKRFGFKTDSLTRPTIISRLQEIVRDHADTINDKETLEELRIITKNKKGRIEAPEGKHDDDMMGLAIAHETRGQVSFTQEDIPVSPQYHFDIEGQRETYYDYGEEITVV